MMLAYTLLAILLVAALIFAVRPFVGSGPQPFPQSPRPEELRTELEVIKSQAKEAEGTERKQLLAQAVRLERQLAEVGIENPLPARLNPAVAGVVVVGVLALGGALWMYTLPRLPGETLVTARNEAKELADLQRKAEKSDTAADWLAYANRAYDLQALDQAVSGYLKVVHKEPRNVVAVRRLGIILFMSGRPQEAIQALTLATAADPKEPEGWLFLGNAHFQLGQAKEAITAWQGYLMAGGEAKERVQGLIETARKQLEATSPGQQVFLAKCATCHGAQAQGMVGPRLQGNPVAKVPEAVREIVTKGRGKMAPVALTPQEMSDLLGYLKGL